MSTKQEILKEILDVKEQIGLTYVKYFWHSLNTSWGLVFCIDTHFCLISVVAGINNKKKCVCQTTNTSC